MMQRKRPDMQRRVDARNTERCGRITGAIVVIAADECDGELTPRAAPAVERLNDIRLHAGARVNEITEYQQLFGAGPREERAQSIKASTRGAVWHRHAVCAERGGLTPVHVGNDQRAGRREQHGAIGKQIDGCAGESDAM
jgi:hypothetical protein